MRGLQRSDAEAQRGTERGNVVLEQGGLQRQHTLHHKDAAALLHAAHEARVLSHTWGQSRMYVMCQGSCTAHKMRQRDRL